jgi:acyl carrier protein
MSKNENSSQGQSSLYREVLEGGIVHFDATGARRESMRRLAATRGEISSNETPKNGENHRDLLTVIGSGGKGASVPIATTSPSRSFPTNRLEYPTASAPIADVSSWKERVQTSSSVPSATRPASIEPITSALVAPDEIERETNQSMPLRDVMTDLADPPLQHAPNKTGISRTDLQKFLIDFVIEQTGYPEDVVSIDADLEADLGIDSIKIAQMMGELNDYFHLNVAALRTKSEADFKSIFSIVEAVLSVESSETKTTLIPPSPISPLPSVSHRLETAEPAVPALQSSATNLSNGTGLHREQLQSFLVAFVVEQTGYPEDIVTMDADLEADLGIDSIKIAQMMGEMNDHFGLTLQDYSGRSMDDFKSLGAIISHLTK